MCAKAMRAASPRGHRHGFDESMSVVSCLNDAFTGVGGIAYTSAHACAVGRWHIGTKRCNHHMDVFGRKRLLTLRGNCTESTTLQGSAQGAMVFQGVLINTHVFIHKVFIECLLCVSPCAGSRGHNCEGEEDTVSALGKLTVMVERDVSQIIRQLNVKLLPCEVPRAKRFMTL